MKKISVYCICILIAAYGFAATQKVSLQPVRLSADDDVSSPAAMIVVTAKGAGATRIEALKDAYREAVEKAVGQFVDVEQLVKNDEVLTDQILTQSNAYIEKYDVIKESETDGLVRVFIRATVRKAALVKKISGFMPIQDVGLGDNLKNAHAIITTIDKRNADGAALLANALEGVDPVRQIMSAGIVSTKPKIVKLAAPEKVRLQYPFQVTVDKKRYAENFIPKLRQILDQISTTPPKQIRLLELPISNDVRYDLDVKDYINNGPKDDYSAPVYDGERIFGFPLRDGRVYWNPSYGGRVQLDYKKLNARGDTNVGRLIMKPNPVALAMRSVKPEPRTMIVLLVTDVGQGVAHGVVYSINGDAALHVIKWQKGVANNENAYAVVLKDEKGAEVAVQRWVMGRPDCFGRDWNQKSLTTGFVNLIGWTGERTSRYGGSAAGGDMFVWLVTPLLRTSAERYVEWLSFDVAKDDLARIASVSVELED